MAGEDKRKQGRGLRFGIGCVLLIVILMPMCISLFLAVQVMQLRTQVGQLQAQVAAGALQEASDIAAVPKQQEEISEEAAESSQTEDVIRLENQLVWDDIEQNAAPWNSNSGIRRVYLTFDDGPSKNTDKILDILNEYGVKATFFVVGNGKEDYTDQYRRIVEEGHTLGMHSYSHIYRDIYSSLEAYRQDMEKLHLYLYELTGVDSRIARFPGGSSNTASKVDMQELIQYLSEEGITYYDWNISSGDAASGYISANQIANNVLKHVWEYDSVIVLMHDASDKNTTVEALPMIIEKILESENTVLLPISEDTIPIQHVQAECQ